MYPLVRDLAADGIPVTVTCRVLKIARQPYYRWLVNPPQVACAAGPVVQRTLNPSRWGTAAISSSGE